MMAHITTIFSRGNRYDNHGNRETISCNYNKMMVAIEEATYNNELVNNVAIDDLSIAMNLSNVAIAYGTYSNHSEM
jgi:hypothetical protein